MTIKRIIIDYEEQDGPGGDPLDLVAYLVNELDNTGIIAVVASGATAQQFANWPDAKHAAREASIGGFAWIVKGNNEAVGMLPSISAWFVQTGDDLDARPIGTVAEFIDGEEQ